MSTRRLILTIALIATQLMASKCQEVGGELEEEFDADKTVLDLSSKQLKASFDLQEFKNLEAVDLSNNALLYIDAEHFTENKKLQKIDLSGNPGLTFPETGRFLVSSSVRVLNMSNCNVEKIPEKALDGLSLEVLDLRDNPLSFDESTTFDVLATPPRHLIVSEITASELQRICKRADMRVEVVDLARTYECKDVRKENPREVLLKSPHRETLRGGKLKDYVLVDEGLMTGDTHMELLDMMGDDPGLAGSGDSGLAPEDDHIDPETVNEDGTGDEEDATEAEVAVSETPEMPEEDPETPETDTETPETDTEAPEEEEPSETPEPEEVFENDDEENDTEAPVTEEEPLTELAPEAEPETEDREHLPGHQFHESMTHMEHKEEATVKHPNLQRSGVRPIGPVAHAEEEVNDGPAEDNVINTGANQTDTSSSSSKNVIICLIVGAVIMGSVFVGIKMYKDRKTYDMVHQDEDPTLGKEMMALCLPENKPLMEKQNNHRADDENDDIEVLEEVVVDGAKPEEVQDKTAMQILSDGKNSGLPDIDDPSRLSTIIVSNTNINVA